MHVLCVIIHAPNAHFTRDTMKIIFLLLGMHGIQPVFHSSACGIGTPSKHTEQVLDVLTEDKR